MDNFPDFRVLNIENQSLDNKRNEGERISGYSEHIRYDKCAKKVIGNKSVAAWILKTCTRKFSKYDAEYIREKFKTIQNTCSAPTVKVVHDEYNGGLMLSLQQGSKAPAYYRIKISNGKVIKGDLCMF